MACNKNDYNAIREIEPLQTPNRDQWNSNVISWLYFIVPILASINTLFSLYQNVLQCRFILFYPRMSKGSEYKKKCLVYYDSRSLLRMLWDFDLMWLYFANRSLTFWNIAKLCQMYNQYLWTINTYVIFRSIFCTLVCEHLKISLYL